MSWVRLRPTTDSSQKASSSLSKRLFSKIQRTYLHHIATTHMSFPPPLLLLARHRFTSFSLRVQQLLNLLEFCLIFTFSFSQTFRSFVLLSTTRLGNICMQFDQSFNQVHFAIESSCYQWRPWVNGLRTFIDISISFLQPLTNLAEIRNWLPTHQTPMKQ